MATVFAAAFATIGVFNPFFPVWMASKSLDPDAIGIVIAAQIALRVLVSPLVLRWTDAAAERALVLVAAGVVSAVLVNLLWLASGFWSILAATLLIALPWSPIVPLSDAIALSCVRRLSIDYGRARFWGSVAFIAANVFSGLALSRYGPVAILPTFSVTFAAAAATMFLAPRIGRPSHVLALNPAPAPFEPVPFSRLRRLAPMPDIRAMLPVLIAIALVQASHAAFYAFGSILWTKLGYSGLSIGIFWAIGVIAEVMLFRQASGLLARFGARAFLVAGGCAAVLRWTASGFDLGFIGFALIQTTHALSFGATHLALQSTIVGAVSEQRLGSAQGAGFALQTATVAAATLASGPLFAALGARAFWLMAVLAAAGTLLACQAAFPTTYPQSRREGGETVARE